MSFASVHKECSRCHVDKQQESFPMTAQKRPGESSMDKDLPAEQIQGIPLLETSLLPVYQKYEKENQSWIPDFDIWSYLNLRADFDLAAAFTKLFWPDFVQVDGCVLLQ